MALPSPKSSSAGYFEGSYGQTELKNSDTLSIIGTESFTKFVRNVDLAAATAKQKPNPWTKRMIMLYFIMLGMSLAVSATAYDSTVLGAVNSYPGWSRYFGFNPETGAASTSLIFSMYSIGSASAFWLTGPIADWRGRKFGIFWASFLWFVFGIVGATSRSVSQFLVAQFFKGVANAIIGVAPIYVMEMAHPSYRGTLSGLYNTFWYVGSIPGGWIPYGAANLPGTLSWRVPLWFSLLFPGLILIGTTMVPESPRWLVSQGRKEEALKILAEIHGEGDEDSPIVQLEYKEMCAEIDPLPRQRWWDYRPLIRTRENRYRMMIALTSVLFSQLCGNAPISYYYGTMLSSAGITNTQTLNILNGMQSAVSYIGALVGAAACDRWGRRNQILSVMTTLTILLVIIVTLNGTNVYVSDGTVMARSSKQSMATIVFTLLFGFTYSVGWTPLQIFYPVECLSYEIRGKGYGIFGLMNHVTVAYNMFAITPAFEGIGWKYYFVYIAFNICSIIYIYYYYVETSHRTLEELTEIFRAQYPVRTSLAKSKIVISGDDLIIHEAEVVYH